MVPIELPPGRYVVQAVLPSGDMVSETLDVGDVAQVLRLQSVESPHEWLSWQRLVGRAPDPRMRFLDSGRSHHLDVVKSMGPSERWSDALLQVWNGAGLDQLPVESVVVQIRDFEDGGVKNYIFDRGPWLDRERYFAVVRDSLTGGTLLAALPVPWRQAAGDPAIEVLVDASGTVEAEWPISVSVVVRDTLMAAVFGYLASGNDQLAGQLIDTAIYVLYEKSYNPVAAAGAAYALLRSAPSFAEADRVVLQWISSLRENETWLPDGAILDGWAQLVGAGGPPDAIGAARALTEAVSRGVPMYTAGVRMLCDGLDRLVSDRDTADITGVRDAFKYARRLSLRLDPRGTFTTLKLKAFPRGASAT